MAEERLKALDERELYDHKQKAMQYYAENGVPQKMEAILNSTYYDDPNDVYGHLVIYSRLIILSYVPNSRARDPRHSRAWKCTLSQKIKEQK